MGKRGPQPRLLEERFWEKVDVQEDDDCWNWLKAKFWHGYGKFSIARSKADYAHRVAWRLGVGPIPDGIEVLHHCDNKLCCNYKRHLFLGTQLDNMQDCKTKGRMVFPPVYTPQKKSSAWIFADVIRQLYVGGGYTYEDLMKLFDTTYGTIQRIVSSE